ncbi:hypothetical protein CCP4SC76_5010008 [Gammaproteobacteria bacterium]
MNYQYDYVFNGNSEVLLNPCNCQPTLYWGTHVSEHIYKHAGMMVRKERHGHGYLELGKYCVTSGGCLRHKTILHIAVLNAMSLDIRYLFKLSNRISAITMELTMESIQKYCEENNIDKIDVPVFWSGKIGWSDHEFEGKFKDHPALQYMCIYAFRKR